MWPFAKTEKRSASYSEVVSALMLSIATGKHPVPHLTAAVESACGLLGRGLSTARVRGLRTEALTPALLSHIGRKMIIDGESLHVIEVINGKIELLPAANFDVSGSSMNPDSWLYRCDVFSPGGVQSLTRSSEGVVHIMWSYDGGSPWRGIGPLARGRLTSGLLAALEGSLLAQAESPTGQIVAVPASGTSDDEATDPLSSLKTDLAGIKGGVMLAESVAGSWGDGKGVSPNKDWIQSKIGFDPSKEALPIREVVSREVSACCGIPPSLVSGKADGTAQRAGLERFLRLTLQPIGNLIADELTRKLETPVSLSFPAIGSGDISARARGFKSLVDGGQNVEKALALSGLLMAEEN